ncbi:alpha-N-acetylgalactosaminide alpha-2,6-sialyltransferase 1 [Leptodactylus fuscus]|uniref:alpha-N-acetylgalactosaminide alpha-2,6-sialyltransferase 1 n=1 Tax=Leptodactylus fuscus TaxID=238119 RepID=UPI003F4EE679
MRFCRLRLFFFFLCHIILVILLLVLFASPIREQLHPKSADKTKSIKVHLEDGAKPKPQENPVNLIKDFLSTIARRAGQSGNVFWDFQLKENEKQNGSVIEKELRKQTQSKPKKTSWNVQSITFGKTTWKPLKATNFPAEPQWKFDEDYIVIPSSHHTSCPISIKIKAGNVSWLKQRFLHDIIMFMDSRHFNNQEWKRLEHFVPPYGWMGLEYSVVKEVVSALPRIANQQLLLAEKSHKTPHCVSCAVVGNGGILNASRMGKEIDSHDYVFRVNGAVTKGYEDDVGKRTSFYGFTAFTMLSSLYMLNHRGFPTIPRDKETKYILFTEGQRDYEWLKALQQNKDLSKGTLEQYRLHPRDDFGEDFDFKKLLVVHPDFSRYLKNRFLRSDHLNGDDWWLYRPSTGALVLLTALHLCDTVSAYGFMTENYEEYSDHYYDDKKSKVVLYFNHDFLLEKSLWARLQEENIIKLYKGTKGL